MVANQPDGAMTSYPVSDHPTDKATYSFEITVPEVKVAVANGLPPRDPVTVDGWTTWYGDAPDLQASYLSTASVGDYEVRDVYSCSSGIPILDFVDDGVTGAALATSNPSLGWQAEMLDFFEGIYGPYPFNSYGAIVDDDSVGHALQTQRAGSTPGWRTKGRSPTKPHMWLGNARLGRLPWLLGETEDEPTSLQREVAGIGRPLGIAWVGTVMTLVSWRRSTSAWPAGCSKRTADPSTGARWPSRPWCSSNGAGWPAGQPDRRGEAVAARRS